MRKIFAVLLPLIIDHNSHPTKCFSPLRQSIPNMTFKERTHERIVPAQLSMPSNELPKGSVILLIGDSLGVGMRSRFLDLTSACGYKSVAHVISGSSTFQWITWIDKDISRHSPSLVIISLGTNDALHFNRAKKIDVYKKFVEHLSNVKYVWILPHKIESERVPNVDKTRELIKTSVVKYFDSTKLKLTLSPDKIHTTTSGYKLWIENVWSRLVQQGIVCDSAQNKR